MKFRNILLNSIFLMLWSPLSWSAPSFLAIVDMDDSQVEYWKEMESFFQERISFGDINEKDSQSGKTALMIAVEKLTVTLSKKVVRT